MSEQEILLEEYKIAQESISHYESLIWNIGSIFNAISVGVLGLAADLRRRFKPRGHLLITFACIGFPIMLIVLYLILIVTG
jgi:hypothetical protein